ncbi:hypothetical protein J2Z48_000785 [Croceifilum oryzae]|uniref:Lipoprotein n=1 Tax=Croceifilum oryzae TaxID=1553429 RepID=A0AAJ1WRS0_9BACL|nr:hypothetical protein [Croceifilum oryzae]MDQ0416618.1 hypothetical protein [Croceifilum oryzae]
MKRMYTLLVSMALSCGMTGCVSEPDAQSVKKEEPTETKPRAVSSVRVHASMDVGEIYDSVEKLSQEFDIVVQGIVQSREFFQREDVPRTKSAIKVTKVIRGEVSVGDTVTFVELGGVRTKGDIAKSKPGKIRIQSGQENDLVPVVFNGIETMKPQEEYILFGDLHPERDLVSQDYYTCVGGYQGKFRVSGNRAKRLTHFVHEADRAAFPLLEIEISKLSVKVKGIEK